METGVIILCIAAGGIIGFLIGYITRDTSAKNELSAERDDKAKVQGELSAERDDKAKVQGELSAEKDDNKDLLDLIDQIQTISTDNQEVATRGVERIRQRRQLRGKSG